MTSSPDYTEVPPLNVKLVDSIPLPLLQVEKERKRELRLAYRTVTLTATSPVQNILAYDPLRLELHIDPLDFPVVVCSSTGQANDANNGPNSVITTPSIVVVNQNGGNVPATGVAWQNPYAVTTQVVISANGATITNVSVNGITVGTAAGTYYVPAYGAISVAYSVATPTWVWTGINIPSTTTSLLNANGRVLNPSVGEYVLPGPNETWLAAAQFPSRVGFAVVREL